jgi:hypothetical protein
MLCTPTRPTGAGTFGEEPRGMNRSDLIRRRRQMHQRIREVVADRRLARMGTATPAQDADCTPEQPSEATK